MSNYSGTGTLTPAAGNTPGAGGSGGGAVASVAGKTGAVTLASTDLTDGAGLASKLTADHSAHTAAFTAAAGTVYDGLDISGGSFVVTLPAASSKWQMVLKVKAATSSTAPTTSATVTPAGTDTLNGGTSGIPLRYVNQTKVYTSDGAGAVTVTGGDFDQTVSDARYNGFYARLPSGTPPVGATFVVASVTAGIPTLAYQGGTAPDTTAPTVTSFAATSGDSQVALSWAGSDNVGITGWTLKRGVTTVYSGTGTSFTDTGLTNGTSYNYTLTASDAAGNVSTTSSASATPAAAAGAGAYGTGVYGAGVYGG